MKLNGLIYTLPKEWKLLIAAFSVVLSIGFYSGLTFVNKTTENNTKGIEENYLGNENNEEVSIMKFKKSENEILSIIHSHIISMSILFFLLGLLVSITALPKKIKLFLIIEPFASILLTFLGIYFLWKEIIFMKYIIMFSGILMTVIFTTSIFVILYQLINSKK